MHCYFIFSSLLHPMYLLSAETEKGKSLFDQIIFPLPCMFEIIVPDMWISVVSAPGPEVKRSTDYVSLLFRMDLPRSRTSIAEKRMDDLSGININDNDDAVW